MVLQSVSNGRILVKIRSFRKVCCRVSRATFLKEKGGHFPTQNTTQFTLMIISFALSTKGTKFILRGHGVPSGEPKGSGFNYCNSCMTDSERVLILPLLCRTLSGDTLPISRASVCSAHPTRLNFDRWAEAHPT